MHRWFVTVMHEQLEQLPDIVEQLSQSFRLSSENRFTTGWQVISCRSPQDRAIQFVPLWDSVLAP